MHPPPEGYAEMPADAFGDDDNSILESPRALADDFRGSDSTPTGDGPVDRHGGSRPMLELNLPEHSPVELPTHDDYFELGTGNPYGRAGPSELPGDDRMGAIPMRLRTEDVPPSSPSVYSPQVDHRSGMLDTPIRSGGGGGMNGSYLDLPSSVDGSGKVWRQSLGLGFGRDESERPGPYEHEQRPGGGGGQYEQRPGAYEHEQRPGGGYEQRQGRYEIIEEPSPPPSQRGALRIANRTSAYEGDVTDWRDAGMGQGRHSRGPSRELR